MKKNGSPYARLVLITQFGLSLITPMLLCIFVSVWIQRRYQTGSWVILAGLILGLLSMANTFYRFYQKFGKTREKEQKPDQYNNHF